MIKRLLYGQLPVGHYLGRIKIAWFNYKTSNRAAEYDMYHANTCHIYTNCRTLKIKHIILKITKKNVKKYKNSMIGVWRTRNDFEFAVHTV